MNAASGQNLSCVFFATGDGACTARETGGTLGDVADTPRFCRTTMTRIQGVSDPLRIRRGTAIGGVAEGVAHAPDASATAADNRAHCETGGTERRPVHRNEVAHCKEHRQINAADNDVDQAAQLSTNSSPGGGNTAPASVFPPSWRTFIRKLRILGGVEFIEAPPLPR
jgi:hypothetical protein